MLPILRVVIAVVAVLMLVGGLLVVMVGGIRGISGFWAMALGAAGLVGVAFERMRYSSEAAEKSGDAPGHAGVDSGAHDPRFVPTEERFVDPTTRRQLRVWMDPANGERRYRIDE